VKPLRLYAIFHLNLAFSSLEEEQRPLVVERCYAPLVRLARELDLPFGIEATGTTLEAAAAADPAWLDDLRTLLDRGRAELVGSGLVQLIGPLVPAEVNRANLRLGHETYVRLLGRQPKLALVNEQAYSAGIVPHYRDAGYEALVMEWDNPFRGHPEWPSDLRYRAQRVVGADGETLPLLWNNSIAFQKVQRYAHGELELDELLDYLGSHCPPNGEDRVFSLYGNDVEVFDFRPGRFATEPPLAGESEWARLARLFEAIAEDPRFELVGPSEALSSLAPETDEPLALETADQPIPVKKQDKYNITRWAVTGRDDLGANTACWRIYTALRRRPDAPEWRDLVELWASDFRTHITEKRWSAFRARLTALESRVCVADSRPPAVRREATVQVERDARWLVLTSRDASVRLSLRRGLAVDALSFAALGPERVVGTLPHGYYDDIALGADYYTGHLVLESPGRPKVTDLGPVEPQVEHLPDGSVAVTGEVATPLGPIRKRVVLHAGEPRLELETELVWDEVPAGSLRLGHVTLDPASFDPDGLVYATHNGGDALERFRLNGTRVDHGDPATYLVSASQAIGITGGVVELGDARRRLRVEVDKSSAAVVGLVTYRHVGDTWFGRLALSAQESDETCRPGSTTGIRRFRLALLPA
jgi:hypothetical protein